MKVENTTTGHSRTLRFTDIPDTDLKELLVSLYYVSGNNEPGVIAKACVLDHFVIPAIIDAVMAANDKGAS